MSGAQQTEASFAPLAFEGFSGGLNTDASRPGIKDDQLFICDGFIPIGESQLRTIPGIGASIFAASTSTTVEFFDFGNIGPTPYMIVVESDGSVWQVDTVAHVSIQIAPAGTIANPVRQAVGLTQWGNQFIILVAQQPNGYFIFDGTLFYQPGTIGPFDLSQLTDGGENYTSAPTYTVYGGSGSGVVLTPILTEGSVTGLTIDNAGTGYLPGDIVQVAFSGGGSDTTPILEAVLATGVVAYLTLISGGADYPTGTFALGISGGGGSGATGTFTTAGGTVSSITLTGGGANYISAPAVSFPIPGTGGSITATESGGAVNALTIVSGGSGYVPGTYPLSLTGGGGSGALATYTVNGSGVIASTTITAGGAGYTAGPAVVIPTGSGAAAVASITPGAVASITIVNGGTNLTGTPLLTIVGGGGSGATAIATVTSGAITAVDVTNGGSGYSSTPAVEVQSGLNNAAAALLTVMPFGISGTAIETYESRLWIVNPYSTNPQGAGGTCIFSAPESYTDFSTANGGGSFTSNDSFLRVAYTQPRQTNGFLYFIADSSVNYVAGVSTSGDPPTTTFTNQNADPETGTPYASTVDVLGSNIVFANAFGVHVSYGGRVTKVSEALDGIYNTVPNFDGFNLSAAKHILYGKRVWALLLPVIDQVTGEQVNKLMMWDEKRWWTTQQDIDLIYIQHQEIASVINAYGTDGTKIYPLFTSPSTAITKTAQSKLWAKPGGFFENKSSNRVWMLGQYYNASDPNINVSIDTETSSSPITLTPTPALGTIYVSPPTAVGQQGALLGMTITTNAADFALIASLIDGISVGYRG
jgi:hypothetical protein